MSYEPTYLVTPAEVLTEHIDAHGFNADTLAEAMSVPVADVKAVLERNTPITPNLAERLSVVLGMPAHFWLNLEHNYQTDKARLASIS